jgi:hypothetical protein
MANSGPGDKNIINIQPAGCITFLKDHLAMAGLQVYDFITQVHMKRDGSGRLIAAVSEMSQPRELRNRVISDVK